MMKIHKWLGPAIAVAGLSLLPGLLMAQQSCSADRGLATPDGNFVDAGNGTVRHVPTGLIWKRCAETQVWNGQTCVDVAGVASFGPTGAIDRVAAVNGGTAGDNAGRSDWRLPSIDELRSIVEYACGNPSINLAQFPSAPAAPFWSATRIDCSTPFGPSRYCRYLVDFRNGDFGTGVLEGDLSFGGPDSANVRLVRGGNNFVGSGSQPPALGWSPVFRFFNWFSSHFYTLSVDERDLLIQHNPLYRYEGVGFYASPGPAIVTVPVYRFYNETMQDHFYTIDQGERDLLIRSNPLYRYEGIAFYASPEARPGVVPLFRFYNPVRGRHFYTISEWEKAGTFRTSPWQFEGVRFYVAPAP